MFIFGHLGDRRCRVRRLEGRLAIHHGEDIALEEVGDGIWNIVYYSTLLGKIDERTSRITGIRPGA
jgi:hypothetical protein